jgi:hypothetical protein
LVTRLLGLPPCYRCWMVAAVFPMERSTFSMRSDIGKGFNR